MFKRFFLLVTVLSFSTACSGGSSADTIPTASAIPVEAHTVTGVDGKDYAIPAEPDPAMNKATLAGVDSNSDGIRDDVERWIAATWKPGSKEYFAVRQLARDTQKDVTDTASINNVTKHLRMDETAKAIDCLWKTYPGFKGKAGDSLLEIMAENTLNTAARWNAYRESQSRSSGAISDGKYDDSPVADVCEGK